MVWRRLLPLLVLTGASACDSPFLHQVVERKASTDQGCVAPNGGVSTLAAATAPTTNDLGWETDASDENGFVVERRSSAAPTWGELIRLAAGTRTYSDGQIERDTEYFYRVSAFRLAGGQTCPSPVSPEASVRTRPRAPATFAATVVRAAAIDLAWSDDNTFETGVRIERRRESDVAFEVLATLPADAVSYADTSVVSGLAYVYRLVVFNDAGEAEALERAQRAVTPPALTWSGEAFFEPACVLSAPGTATFDVTSGALFESAEGVVAKGTPAPAVVADEAGVSATLADFGPGAFEVSWSVTDSTGAESTLTRSLEIISSTARRGPARRPRLSAGERAADGLQALTPACANCAGVRASINAGDAHTCLVTDAGEVRCFGSDYEGGACIDKWGDPYPCSTGRLGFGAADRALGVATACDLDADGVCTGALTGFAAVEAGEHFTCAVTIGGEARCWGSNYYGNLGNGDDGYLQGVVPVCTAVDAGNLCTTHLTGVQSLAAGESHACARLTSGEVWCWGAGYSGQLGDGGTTSRYIAGPVCATGTGDTCVALTGATAIAVGVEHTCALGAGGAVWCWGANDNGELTEAPSTQHENPVALCAPGGGACTPLTGVDEVGAGGNFTCVRIGGDVYCAGYNEYGQLGDGTTTSSAVLLPVCTGPSTGACGPITDAVELHVGYYDACVRRASGELWCWGRNDYDQLGHDVAVTDQIPYAVPACASGEGASCVALTGITSFAVGTWHVCARLATGQTRCFGDGNPGSLGYGGSGPIDDPSVVCRDGSTACVPELDLVSLTAGYEHVCALQGQDVVCWGANEYSEIALENRLGVDVPTPVLTAPGAAGAPLTDATAVGAGLYSSCAVREDATVWCWGIDQAGQLGTGVGKGVRSFARPVCASGTSPTCTPLGSVASVAVGDEFACALLLDGHVRCWGLNDCGQLGNGETGLCDGRFTVRSTLPTPVCTSGSGTSCVALDRVVSINAGPWHACALRDDGRLWCWGYNFNGQIGDGTVNHRRWAGPVCASGDGDDCVPLEGVVSFATAVDHSCAVLQGGEAMCWGFAGCGELGAGGTPTCQTSLNALHPVSVCADDSASPCPQLDGVVAMSGGVNFTCALLEDGAVRCWGRPDDGRLGNGATDGSLVAAIPAAVCVGDGSTADACDGTCPGGALSGAVAIAAGAAHVCVVLEDGWVRCWGDNRRNQLGAGDLSTWEYCAAIEVCAGGDGEGCVGGAVYDELATLVCDVYTVQEVQ